MKENILKKNKGKIYLISALITFTLALFTAIDALSHMRLVTLVTIFGSSFGAGASIVAAIYDWKINK